MFAIIVYGYYNNYIIYILLLYTRMTIYPFICRIVPFSRTASRCPKKTLNWTLFEMGSRFLLTYRFSKRFINIFLVNNWRMTYILFRVFTIFNLIYENIGRKLLRYSYIFFFIVVPFLHFQNMDHPKMCTYIL